MKATVKKSLGRVQEYTDVNALTGARRDISEQWRKDPCWTRVFLPTLTHVLYNSEHPFTDWTLDSSKLVPIVQTVFDLSFTNISYTLSLGDSVVKGV